MTQLVRQKSWQRWILPEPAQVTRREWWFWLALSLAFSASFGWLAYQQGTAGPYVVQDDARQHVFWMQRYLDPALFPDDPIADYFQGVAPVGYRGLYWGIAKLGISPLDAVKWLPIFLGLITTFLMFNWVTFLLPIPTVGFVGALLLDQTLWTQDDLASGTPRAFLFALFLAVLNCLVRQKKLALAVSLVLLGCFYPQYLLVAAGVLIVRLAGAFIGGEKGNKFKPLKSQKIAIFGLAVAIATLTFYALQSSDYGPVVDRNLALTLPEFSPDGRANYFDNDWGDFWLLGKRSSLMPRGFLTPIPLVLGLLLPLGTVPGIKRWIQQRWERSPIYKGIHPEIHTLSHWCIASLGLFFLAHALIFRLHLPGRYTQHGLTMLMPTAAAIAWGLLTDQLFTWNNQHKQPAKARLKTAITLAISVSFTVLLLIYPATLGRYPKANYVTGETPILYEFFKLLPNTIKIAGIADELDNIPTFSARSVYTAREYGIPYHWGYYRGFRDRTIATMEALYSPDVSVLKQFNNQAKINFWLVDQDTFTVDYLEGRDRRANDWLKQYQPTQSTIIQKLQRGEQPAMVSLIPKCTVLDTGRYVVIDANCLNADS
ncbi:MAG: hypothetical protein ACFCA4_16195 [Cyanophyceae cyanobacterium]